MRPLFPRVPGAASPLPLPGDGRPRGWADPKRVPSQEGESLHVEEALFQRHALAHGRPWDRHRGHRDRPRHLGSGNLRFGRRVLARRLRDGKLQPVGRRRAGEGGREGDDRDEPGAAGQVRRPLRGAARRQQRRGLGQRRAHRGVDAARTPGREGDEQWWAWSTMFAPDFSASNSDWNIFTQFHNSGTTGGRVEFYVNGNTLGFTSHGGDINNPTARSWDDRQQVERDVVRLRLPRQVVVIGRWLRRGLAQRRQGGAADEHARRSTSARTCT